MVIKKMNKVVIIGGSGFIGSHIEDAARGVSPS
jgi:nucleoside-diphosphate-sugar epimerase